MSVVKNCAPSLGEGGVRTSDSSDAGGAGQLFSSKATPPLLSTKSESPVSSSCVSTSAAAGSLSRAAVQREDSTEGDHDGNSGDDTVSSTVGLPQVDQDEPLSFNSSMKAHGWSSTPLVSPMLPEMYATQSGSSAAGYWQQQHYAQMYSAETEQVGKITRATRGVTVSMSAFLACHQCYYAGSSLVWGLNLWAVVCGIF